MRISKKAARLGVLALASIASAASVATAAPASGAATEDPAIQEAAAQLIPTPKQDNSAVKPLKPGVYKETTTGNNGFVEIDVTLSERHIDDIKIVKSAETPYIADAPMANVINEVLTRQTLTVDAVTGATHATQAVLRAVGQAIEKAGGASTEWAPEPQVTDPATLPEAAAEETDVIVVGGGASGLAAAAAAAESGARVIVLDKAARTGGALALSSGRVAAADAAKADAMRDLWLKDQNYDAKKALIRKIPDAARVEALVRSSASTLAWLDKAGIHFNANPMAADGMGAYAFNPVTPDGWKRPAGAFVADQLADHVKALGGQIRPATTVWRLVREGDTVTGVEASDGTHRMTLRAKAVILASGGFGANLVRMADTAPRWTVFYGRRATPASATGDGIDLATSAGGVEVNDAWMVSTTIAPAYAGITPAMFGPQGLAGATLVNEKGERFAREDRAGLTDAIAAQRDCWLVTDAADHDRAEKLIAYFGYSNVVDGKSLLELGRRMGVKAEVFEKKMERYNADVKAGADTKFARDPQNLTPIEKAPFFAVRVQPVIAGTIGGVLTNETQQVTTRAGAPIPGLWATGEMANRPFYNRVYEPGTALLVAFTTGRTAGVAAAKAALGK